VQLLGRKESTRVVLETSLANVVRTIPWLCLFTDRHIDNRSFAPAYPHARASRNRGRCSSV
jgi:hypothetical protein